MGTPWCAELTARVAGHKHTQGQQQRCAWQLLPQTPRERAWCGPGAQGICYV